MRTSTITLPFCAAGSIRTTSPATMPLRVSTEAWRPGETSCIDASGMRSRACRRSGTTTFASGAPAVTDWPASTATCCTVPAWPARTCERVELLAAVLGERAQALDLRVLRLELRGVAAAERGESLGLERLAARRPAIARSLDSALSIVGMTPLAAISPSISERRLAIAESDSRPATADSCARRVPSRVAARRASSASAWATSRSASRAASSASGFGASRAGSCRPAPARRAGRAPCRHARRPAPTPSGSRSARACRCPGPRERAARFCTVPIHRSPRDTEGARFANQ